MSEQKGSRENIRPIDKLTKATDELIEKTAKTAYSFPGGEVALVALGLITKTKSFGLAYLSASGFSSAISGQNPDMVVGSLIAGGLLAGGAVAEYLIAERGKSIVDKIKEE